MSKQEEIREGIAKRHCEGCLPEEQCSEKRVGKKCPEYYETADEELGWLHSQGVVIKVERELPLNPFANQLINKDEQTAYYYWNQSLSASYLEGQEDMLKTGYVATKSLLGGEDEQKTKKKTDRLRN